jgi:hypothetical protein
MSCQCMTASQPWVVVDEVKGEAEVSERCKANAHSSTR